MFQCKITGEQRTCALFGWKVKDAGVDLAEYDVEEAGDHVGAFIWTPIVIALDNIVLVEEDSGGNGSLIHDVPLERRKLEGQYRQVSCSKGWC